MNRLRSKGLTLNPGDVYFGRDHSQVSTLLGSCVAVTLWHPERRLGGMCHFVLPTRGMGLPWDGRYGDEALAFLMRRLREEDTVPEEYQAGIFGGGDMFPQVTMVRPRVGEQNVAMARRLMRQCGFNLGHHDVGSTRYRQVVLSLNDGSVRVRATDVKRL